MGIARVKKQKMLGGEVGIDRATKAITDFVTLNNMFGVDMETTKFASIYGYAGRLFYIDLDGNIRVMPVHGYETIILSSTDISWQNLLYDTTKCKTKTMLKDG
ncbi:MAG: hypothetical protein V8S74_06365 [Lachnospirales bacterium]